MTVLFSQIYIEVGATFPFSHGFQNRLSAVISNLTEVSPPFVDKFGADWHLIFRISAKRGIAVSEIRGPTVFRKAKDVEFTVFLPFDILIGQLDVERSALHELLYQVCGVLDQIGISSARVRAQAASTVTEICADPTMFDRRKRA